MKITSFCIPIIYLWANSLCAQTLPLETYLKSVQEKNSGLRAAQKAIYGSQLKLNEAHIYDFPVLFINGMTADDQRPTSTPSFQGTETRRTSLQTGVMEQFKFGTKATLSYNMASTTINGANPLSLPQSSYYDLSPQIEVSQSLWKNFLGQEIQAGEDLLEGQNELVSHAEKFRFKQLLLQAEASYWRMAMAQKVVQVQTESLERSQKIKDWSYGRYKKGLADESDFLQSSTAYTARQLEFQNAQMDERIAARAFNTLLELEQETVSETLQIPSDQEILLLALPERKGLREDVEVAKAQKKMAQAQSILGIEKNTPLFEVYGQYSLNGRAVDTSPAMDESFTQDHPAWAIGFRFNSPLDLANLIHNRQGYNQDKQAAELNFQRKLYEEEREWKDLIGKFKDCQERFVLSQKMEVAQKEKLDNEKNRFSRGRSTTFQLLQFEQDYANAQLLKLKNEAELLITHAQLKIFSTLNWTAIGGNYVK